MTDSFYITTVIQVTLTSIDTFLALLYCLPILFVCRFQHHNNMFILNICLTIIISCAYFIILFLMRYFDPQRLFTPNTCLIVFYAYNVAGMSIPSSFVTFTVHRYFSIVHHTKPFFKTKRWIIICISGQWIGQWIISSPFALRSGPYCVNELWMQFYKLVTAVLIPTLINVTLNILIFTYVRSSVRRVQPQSVNTSASANQNRQPPTINRREISLLRQMVFVFLVFIIGWAPAFLVAITNYFIPVAQNIIAMTGIISQLCILSIIINLFMRNVELQQYLKQKIGR